MSTNKISTEYLGKSQKEDFEFYKKLGFTEEQAYALAYYNFNEYGDDRTDITTVLSEYQAHRNEIPFSKFFCEHVIRVKLERIKRREEYEKALREENEKLMVEDASNINNTKVLKEKAPKGGFFSNLFGHHPSSVNYSIAAPMPKKTKQDNSKRMLMTPMECTSLEECRRVAPRTSGAYSPELMSSAINPIAPIAPITPMNIHDAITLGADTESYDHIEEKGFQKVSDSPTSSFRTTCNTASIGNLMNQLRNGRMIKPDSVRIEELMNFFDYDIVPTEDVVGIHAELCDKPHSKNKLLFVGVKGKEEALKKQNIVLLLDVSGSMGHNSRIMKKTIMTVVSKMKDGDVLSLITYSSQDHTVFEGLTINSKSIETIIEKLLEINIYGYTNGSAGIESAYQFAADNFIENGINKVILMTDGDLNFGINSNNGLEKLILEKKKTNVFLSVIGMGTGNLKDDKLEVLAKNGNGNYCVINDHWELDELLIKRYNSIIHTVAKDVKAQVEFNPAKIKSYRLLGYENRAISHTEFNDDKVIAEPFGSGSVCVAMYELEMADGEIEDSGLKYQTKVVTDSPEYCTVSVRYKLPLADESTLVAKPVDKIEEMSDNVKLAFICYAIAEKFRNSKFNDLKDELFARYLAETMKDDEIKELNGDKIELLKFLAK